MTRTRTIRDPLWGNIRVGRDAAPILDTPQFQRLRGVKQLGLAHLVYPGAVHTRFLHALGVYHLTSRAVEALERSGALGRLDARERAEIPLVRLAALLHDIGHYAFSHAMEEIGPEAFPGHHEEVASRFLRAEPIRRALETLGDGAPERIAAFIRAASDHPLQGLVAGSLDLDKIDYLRRDGLFCGVPYGAVDVDRLLDALTLAREADGRPLEVAVTEKGVSALETLLFSKYQMFRNVYWHHGVRAATSAFRRLVESALAARLLRSDELAGPTDEELLALIGHRLRGRATRWTAPAASDGEAGPPGPDAEPHPAGAHPADPAATVDPDPAEGLHARVRALLEALVRRRLPKRALELMGDSLPDGVSSWVAGRPDLVRELEDRLAREWGVPRGGVMLDYPGYPEMLQLRLLLVRRDGGVQRLTSRGERGLIDLPRLSRSLHHAARVFRAFTLDRIEPRDPAPLLELIEAPAAQVEERLAESRPLY